MGKVRKREIGNRRVGIKKKLVKESRKSQLKLQRNEKESRKQ